MRLTSIMAAALGLILAAPVHADVVTFNDFSIGVSGYVPLGSSFVDSGFQFTTSGTLTVTNYAAYIFYGPVDQGIKFSDAVTVSKVNGASFDLIGLYIMGGINYDGAAPAVTPGTLEVEAKGANGTQFFSEYLPDAGFVNINLPDVSSFSLSYLGITPSTSPLFDDLTFASSALAVPELASWTMALFGFGVIGAMMRRSLPASVAYAGARLGE